MSDLMQTAIGRHMLVAAGATMMLFLPAACGPAPSDGAPPAQPAHDETDHDSEGHDDDAHDEHGEEELVRLSDAQIESAGVAVAPLAGGAIAMHLTLPAEISVNQDTLVHVTPRAAGIASEVRAFLGDEVETGRTLVVLESSELGEVKIALLQAAQQHTVASAALELQRTVSANTSRLLEILAAEPDLAQLRESATGLRVGENKGRLMAAYARTKSSEANYARERSLRQQGLSTEADMLAAQEAYNSALAEYMAIFEEVDFLYQVRRDEAQRAAAVATTALQNARRRLVLLGLTESDIDGVPDEAPDQIARYEVAAPISGRIISKHIAPGEKVMADAAVYSIADLSTVWLNIAVYESYLSLIRVGQAVVVHAGDREAQGTVTYIASALSEGTRTVTARVVLDNASGKWIPGEFLTVQIETEESQVARRVPVGALQQWEGRDVVFVREGDAFEPRPVRVGRRNARFAELLGDDVPLGAPVVVNNSFLLKAELGKSSAGHDH
jgi:cobalt-zinc-cadmium efflux system membrane fusion protein